MKLDAQLVADAEILREEFARHEAMMRAMTEIGSLESAVAKAAFDRIATFVADLQLDSSISEIAQQVLSLVSTTCWLQHLALQIGCWNSASACSPVLCFRQRGGQAPDADLACHPHQCPACVDSAWHTSNEATSPLSK